MKPCRRRNEKASGFKSKKPQSSVNNTYLNQNKLTMGRGNGREKGRVKGTGEKKPEKASLFPSLGGEGTTCEKRG